ncbi:tRNA threonylcarbamoyladenosine biosynthesis protein TsaE [Rhodoglobus vestalii]|uniref:tRNA threonylcarbamoyladenosine biosynthesis protein TsaE n=1 Tax=Rhodoglobus vestalii TaxID=193384 RepID=A0A8H2K860_9MICO|nr:tRNA (adenosine(37)-N6)-threonylcarbamoyltransferase complex ATPase subunit type 1 TsaE [Rhodoglobus vestalii]TQO20449.1 tRNA threonylcarbamoyladenosine biosynthesis protein TsaE [Rhodoglobus vestalii]
MTRLAIDSPERMVQLGTLIATQLSAGDLVLLNGELGAGKTTLTRSIGETLGIRGTVTSPTFVLARTHPRADDSADVAPLVHVDAYRLGSAIELDDLDLDFAASIVVVEWGAGLLDGVSESWLNIDIIRPTGASDEHPPADDFSDELNEPRTVTVTGNGPRWANMGWLDVFSD